MGGGKYLGGKLGISQIETFKAGYGAHSWCTCTIHGAECQRYAKEGARCREYRELTNKNKTTESQSVYYYHHVLAILNNISEYNVLPGWGRLPLPRPQHGRPCEALACFISPNSHNEPLKESLLVAVSLLRKSRFGEIKHLACSGTVRSRDWILTPTHLTLRPVFITTYGETFGTEDFQR